MDERYGRNDPCPCGSGQKYENCHGQMTPSQRRPMRVERTPTGSATSPGTTDVAPADLRQLATLHAAGRFVDLERTARALAARSPTSGVAWKALGVALRMQSKDPIPALEKAAELSPRDAEAHANLGVALLECNRVQDALSRFQRALALKPDYAEVHNMLGNVQLDHGRAEMAETCYRNAVAIQPNYADAHCNLGNVLLQLRRFEEAATSYRCALQINPDYAEVHNNLGNVLMELGQTAGAIESYRRATELQPQLAAAHASLGNALLQLRRPEEAAESCRRAAVLQPDSAVAQGNLGMALLDLGRFDEAAARFRRAIEIRPNFAEAHHNLGHAWRGLGRYDEAVASYRAAVTIKPDLAEAHNDLGVGLRLLGRTAEAEESCQRSLELNPNAPVTLVTLGEAQADKGEFAEAEQLFRRALALQPDLVQGLSGIAYVRKLTSDDTAWREAAERLLLQSLPQQDAMALHYALGKYFDDLQQYSDAFEHYQRANELKKQSGERYHPEQLAETVDELIRIYSRDWLEQARPYGTASSRPVFIIGMPRSGTSLAEQILASHPQVFGAGELMFWSNASNGYKARLRRATGPVELPLHQFAQDYLQLLERLSPDAQRVIDKMPGNFMHLGLLHAALPQARIIHMRRDPIDTCLSIYFQNFSGVIAYANDLHDLAHYYQQYRRIMQHWESVLPTGQVLDVPYEALVADQESFDPHHTRIYRFAGAGIHAASSFTRRAAASSPRADGRCGRRSTTLQWRAGADINSTSDH